MSKIKKFGACMFNTFFCIMRNMRLSDIFLLIFMGILMLQSVYNLFFHEIDGSRGGTIDVIVRTTAAGIFGYFIGAGFLRDDLARAKKKAELAANSMPLQRNTAPEPTNIETLKADLAKQQTIIVATIGIFSLMVLGLVNANFDAELSMNTSATVSQLRDFVSGSVGLLIGNSARKNL